MSIQLSFHQTHLCTHNDLLVKQMIPISYREGRTYMYVVTADYRLDRVHDLKLKR